MSREGGAGRYGISACIPAFNANFFPRMRGETPFKEYRISLVGYLTLRSGFHDFTNPGTGAQRRDI